MLNAYFKNKDDPESTTSYSSSELDVLIRPRGDPFEDPPGLHCHHGDPVVAMVTTQADGHNRSAHGAKKKVPKF